MARRLLLASLVFALTALVLGPSRADVTPVPDPFVVACAGRRVGQRCVCGRSAGLCLTEIRRRFSPGLLWLRESTTLVCVPSSEITEEMRACIGRREHETCSLEDGEGSCELVEGFLECLPPLAS